MRGLGLRLKRMSRLVKRGSGGAPRGMLGLPWCFAGVVFQRSYVQVFNGIEVDVNGSV